MILTTHELVGAAIGAKIHNPWLIVIFSLAMHFVLDTFRHGEYLDRKSKIKDTLWKVALDLSAGFIIVLLYIFLKNPDSTTIWHMLLGIFISIFPDSLTFLYWQLGVKFLKKPFEFHAWLHAYPQGVPERTWNLRNAANDIVISLLAIIILFVK
jgi:hypothetical protein